MTTAVSKPPMKFKIVETHVGEIKILAPTVFADDRGFFMESYRADEFQQLGLPTNFVQDNHSRSGAGVLRGLHFQYDPPMGKLMRVGVGRAWLVAVDMRKSSPTLGQWWGTEISADNKLQKTDTAIRWDDPDIGIEWPLAHPQISQRDSSAMTLKEWLAMPESNLVR
jgi:dTDP-4-dehydrorhamnose 3,5-epimerase